MYLALLAVLKCTFHSWKEIIGPFLKDNDVPCDEIIPSGAFSSYGLLRKILRSLFFEPHPLGVSSYV